ncbi:MAG: PKD domain-containing protein, partial [Bacteroidota bacterium]|nr:PKD domain-containing protein [Bacteroidota bacterium]
IKVYGPVPQFDIDEPVGCGEVQVNFINTSENVKSFYMEYGDASRIDSNVIKPHLYSYNDFTKDSILYFPRMFAVDDSNCLSVFRDTVKLYRPPTAKFTVSDSFGCSPFTVAFTNTSKYGSKYFWDFNGDGDVEDTTFSPSYTYSLPGTYSVSLRVVTNKGCEETYYKKDFIVVNPVPEAKFSYTPSVVCWGDTVKFSDSSLSNVPIKRWHWDFDDGGLLDDTSGNQHPSYVFRRAGFHTVRLIIENENGCV